MPGAKIGDEGTWGGLLEWAEGVLQSATLVHPMLGYEAGCMKKSPHVPSSPIITPVEAPS
jgi:hypothetical protein